MAEAADPLTRLRRDDYVVKTVPLRVCQEMVQRLHYARGGSNTATFRHGLFHRADPLTCCGIAWWIPPTKAAAVASWQGDWREVLALSRLVVLPEMPKNAATFLLAASVSLIRQDGRFCCLVTYADTWQKHDGTVYRAANWEYLGQTAPEPVFVEKATGRMVARKAGAHTRTRSEMAELGCENVGAYPRHKFRLVVSPAHKATPRGQIPLRLT